MSVTAVPNYPPTSWASLLPGASDRDEGADKARRKIADDAWKRARGLVEKAVRDRRLTPPTPPLKT